VVAVEADNRCLVVVVDIVASSDLVVAARVVDCLVDTA